MEISAALMTLWRDGEDCLMSLPRTIDMVSFSVSCLNVLYIACAITSAASSFRSVGYIPRISYALKIEGLMGFIRYHTSEIHHKLLDLGCQVNTCPAGLYLIVNQ